MRRRTRMLQKVLWLALTALLALAVFAGLQLWRVSRDARRAAQLLEQMRRTAFTQPAASAVPGQPADSAPPADSTAAPDSEAMPDGEPAAHFCPYDFDALRGQYPDAVAWLTGCGGEIDTPIVQGADNQYYLRHLPDGTENLQGAAFLDGANSASFSDDQSFLFGHHMDTGGGVFAPLLRYREQAYAQQYPAFVLHTPSGCFRAEVFAAFLVSERGYPYVHAFASAQAALDCAAQMRARSDVAFPVEPALGDRLLTLCTCTSKVSELRYVVCTRLSPLAGTP